MATVMILLHIATVNNYATMIKLIKLPQQINDRFDITDKWLMFKLLSRI